MRDFPDQGVLAATRADHQNSHRGKLKHELPTRQKGFSCWPVAAVAPPKRQPGRSQCSGRGELREYAKQSGLAVIGLTGFAGGRMLALCDTCIVIPSDNMQVVEDLHLSVAHALFTCVRAQVSLHPPAYAKLRPTLVRRTAGK